MSTVRTTPGWIGFLSSATVSTVSRDLDSRRWRNRIYDHVKRGLPGYTCSALHQQLTVLLVNIFSVHIWPLNRRIPQIVWVLLLTVSSFLSQLIILFVSSGLNSHLISIQHSSHLPDAVERETCSYWVVPSSSRSRSSELWVPCWIHASNNSGCYGIRKVHSKL